MNMQAAAFLLMYVRLARKEEQDALAEFGDEYRRYMRGVPAFFPKLGGEAEHGSGPQSR